MARSSAAPLGGKNSSIWTSTASLLSEKFLTDRGVEPSFFADRKGVRPAVAACVEQAVGTLGLKTVGRGWMTTESIAVMDGGERGAESARPRGFLATERFCVGDMLQSSALRGLQT